MPPPQPPTQNRGPSPWESRRRPGTLASLCRLLLLVIIALALTLPFTPFASKIKSGLKELIREARGSRTEVVTREITREVQVPKEIVREVVKEVRVPVAPPPAAPSPPPALPEIYVPRKDVEVATLFNGITIKTNLLTEQGSYASLERLDPDSYKAEFQLSIRVPKANQTLPELSRINPKLGALLPDLDAMLTTGKVSGFYHKLYENKTNSVERDITRLSKVLDRHNFFDCETILELTHPASKRKVLLIQSEMDVVCDGSDGDRMPTLDEYIYLSSYYQPFTSYTWTKTTKTPNPLLANWEDQLKRAKDQLSAKGLSTERSRELKARISQLEIEVRELKLRSSLIAEKDPFIVLSLLFRPYIGQNKFTPQIGDYAVVVHEGKMYPAICGDNGPTSKMGEASLFMAKAINPKSTPYRRPESDLKVTYLVFPGTAEKPNTAPNLDHWHDRCTAFLKDIGAPGSGHELHRWEDPFKKPEPYVEVGPPKPGTPGTDVLAPPALGPVVAPMGGAASKDAPAAKSPAASKSGS
ncbi:MAG: glycoside hydrolase family 75 protein [Prosthecobacter sp.]|nr:glycoside hydrolase family 75 protein [Prosthecobacter sp.]